MTIAEAAPARERFDPVRGAPLHATQAALFWRQFRRHKPAVVSAALLVAIVFAGVSAPFIAPYDPNKLDLQLARFGRPAPPSADHPMGTDTVGRDQLSRIIYGSRVSLAIGVIVTGVGITIGTVLGALAGYLGGWVDIIVMRAADALLAFPTLLLLMSLLVSIRPSLTSISILIGAISWMVVARLVRGEFLVQREREYVEAARVAGASWPRIVFRHILPNTLGPIVVAASLGIPSAILTESTLSFLGFGIQPPTASWGNMLQGAFGDMRDHGAWWLGFFPGVTIALTVLAFNFVGDGLRDALDPRAQTAFK